ncbi:MAG: hypothetical protein CR988_01930 [Treponema sp.]|nr:MAG: hypothetical protein CR988_01930 [Treponema sp.]
MISKIKGRFFKKGVKFALCLILLPVTLYAEDIDFRQEMRDFVIGISDYSKSIKKDFFIIPQNGIEIIIKDSETKKPCKKYLSAIDGNGQEDLFYGYVRMNSATRKKQTAYLKDYLDISKNAGNVILAIDYCYSKSKINKSYAENASLGYVSFAADKKRLNNIPLFPSPIYRENKVAVKKLSEVKNFLYLINPSGYESKDEFIDAVTATNYDLLIMDLFFYDDILFTSDEVNRLRKKKNGGERLVIAYMSIGEAEDYRYYWKDEWNKEKPGWLDAENRNWAGNYKVKYWDKDWQKIIFGNDNSYLKKILDAGFDGVYLDIIDAFDYYE